MKQLADGRQRTTLGQASETHSEAKVLNYAQGAASPEAARTAAKEHTGSTRERFIERKRTRGRGADGRRDGAVVGGALRTDTRRPAGSRTGREYVWYND